MSTQPRTYLTPEEYLAIERKAEHKSEYVDGEVCERSDMSLRHSTIAVNIIGELGQQLRGKPCSVLPSDIKVGMPDSRKFFYPDVSVLCGEAQFYDDRRDIILNPIVIVEVLSESTSAFDRGEKFQSYQQLSSLREYLLISQDKNFVQHYVRQTRDSWTYTAAFGAEGTLSLPSIECTLSLEAIYDKTSGDL